MNKNAWILVLEKDNMKKLVRDWEYPVCPTTYYARSGVLGIDEYSLQEVKDNKAYYKYIGPKKGMRIDEA